MIRFMLEYLWLFLWLLFFYYMVTVVGIFTGDNGKFDPIRPPIFFMIGFSLLFFFLGGESVRRIFMKIKNPKEAYSYIAEITKIGVYIILCGSFVGALIPFHTSKAGVLDRLDKKVGQSMHGIIEKVITAGEGALTVNENNVTRTVEVADSMTISPHRLFWLKVKQFGLVEKDKNINWVINHANPQTGEIKTLSRYSYTIKRDSNGGFTVMFHFKKPPKKDMVFSFPLCRASVVKDGIKYCIKGGRTPLHKEVVRDVIKGDTYYVFEIGRGLLDRLREALQYKKSISYCVESKKIMGEDVCTKLVDTLTF